MSILGADATPILVKVIGGIFLAMALGVPMVIAGALRVFRPSAVVGPERLSRRQSPWPLVAAVGMGLMMWVLVQTFYGAWRRSHGVHHGASAESVIANFTPADWAFIVTVPSLAGFATLWLADFVVGGFVLIGRLGFSLRRSIVGIAQGILAAIVILPPTYVFTAMADQVYKHFHYVHPMEHDLLKVMGQSGTPILQWMLILGATLVAPLWEEFLFRGHIQTLLRRTLVSLSSPRLAGMEGLGGYSPMNTPIVPERAALAYEAQVIDRTHVWQTWAAIIIASGLFAMMHPMWMRPPIFVLSLGLGYCYERTGNLWTNMTVHCLFNSVSTFAYLYGMTHHDLH